MKKLRITVSLFVEYLFFILIYEACEKILESIERSFRRCRHGRK